ncbi:carbohydrate ABC transporter permease [Alicyclobacillus dauci]|uniref:Carbohydrate ABC transporter permease n=1 Tax=Alicyclobacillus dauci TaxID=1475485 RepID=A0ABY6Z6Z3_9BACL|nr:carbohydrate ABC transporter permease [Alicyclobacillus dauci]WAH38377.1 carbohydrate ABC transporter permease [Alicyclobacillus dauci]
MRWLRIPLVWIYALLILIPVAVVIESSFKSLVDLYANPLWPSSGLTTGAYHTLTSEVPLLHYFVNSAEVTVAALVMVLLFGAMISYAILRLPRVLGYVVYGVFSVGMMIPTQVNMIPVYLEMTKLNLVDTLGGLILVEAAFLMPVSVFIIGGFMRTMSRELLEAATVDGANEWQIFWRIATPLSLPSVASTAIFGGVIVWNDLLFPLLLTKSNTNRTIPLALLSFTGEYQTNYPVIFAGVLLSSIPMVVLYVFLQRYFIAGMTAGAVKG